MNILEDIKLDTNATCEIISKVKPHQLQAVNVIEVGPSQCDIKDKSQATVRFSSFNGKNYNVNTYIAMTS